MQPVAVAPEALRLFDAVLLAMALEIVALWLLRYLRGIGPGLAPLIANIGAGLFIVLAARLALSGAGLPAIGMCLLAALVSHLTDLRKRWRAVP